MRVVYLWVGFCSQQHKPLKSRLKMLKMIIFYQSMVESNYYVATWGADSIKP